MTSSRPYLIQALIDWIVDNDCTPHLVIDCTVPGVDAPRDNATDGKLVLNISATATRNLEIGNEAVEVDCRFGGRAVHVHAPMGAVVAVYARENGMGLAFDAETDMSKRDDAPGEPKPQGKPRLTLLK